tara:strand:- start:2820 stop:3161 length:342 start_codon:yes stop_codon:yes gene_type:complete
MLKIYHNPRCRKSREGLQILQENGQKFKIIEYLKDPLTFEELKFIVKLLAITPIELVRKNETIWKDNYKGKVLNNDEIISVMIENPKLIERPIVINKQKGILGRPPEKIKQLL